LAIQHCQESAVPGMAGDINDVGVLSGAMRDRTEYREQAGEMCLALMWIGVQKGPLSGVIGVQKGPLISMV
ncbi:MAG: hypothetical protein B7Z07_02675, partial [Sphingomonadales bacterium 32-67-7]